MTKQHIKILSSPKTWRITKKTTKWVTKSRPGPHAVSMSLPLNVILRDILDFTKTTKESKNILYEGKIKIDNKVRKDYKFPIGLMDVISIDDLNKNYRIIISKKGKITPISIKKDEANLKPRKIIGKKILKGKKIQINLSDGTNLISKDNYKVNDTLVFDTSKNDVKTHLKLEKGALVYIIKGKQVGEIGVVKELEKKSNLQIPKILITCGKTVIETPQDYVFVIGKDKPLITMAENE